jgi:hypothetical protein
MARNSSSLIQEPVITLLPSLAISLGVEMALIVQQISFLHSLKAGGRDHDGHHWIWNTYESWQKDHFPWWSVRVVKAYFQELERLGVVISCQPDGKVSRKKYYRLNEGFTSKLTREYAEAVRDEIRKGKSGARGIVNQIPWEEIRLKIEALDIPDGTGPVLSKEGTGRGPSHGTGLVPSVTETTDRENKNRNYQKAPNGVKTPLSSSIQQPRPKAPNRSLTVNNSAPPAPEYNLTDCAAGARAVRSSVSDLVKSLRPSASPLTEFLSRAPDEEFENEDY